MAVAARQRFTRRNPCPICGGGADLPQGQGIRCFGFLSDDGVYAHCTREEHAGQLDQHKDATFVHRLTGDCRCSIRHDPRPHSIDELQIEIGYGAPERRRVKLVTVSKQHDYLIKDVDGIVQAIHRRTDGVNHQGTPDKTFSWLGADGSAGLAGRSSASLPLYGIDRMNGSGEVIVCEGEKAADALLALGLPSVGTVTGAPTLPDDSVLRSIAGQCVYLWADNDAAGARQMAGIAARLTVLGCRDIRLIRSEQNEPKADAFDYLAAGGTAEDVRGLMAAAKPWEASNPAASAGGGDSPRLRITKLSDVEPEKVRWLWAGRIPLGKLTMVDGDPGLGKSTMLLDLAGRLTRGRPLPGDAQGDLPEPSCVIVLSAEDGAADTIRPRLDAAGADCALVLTLQLEDRDGQRELAIPTDLSYLREAIEAHGAKLVIVDPLVAYLGTGIDSHRDQDVRRALAPLARLAGETGAAIVGVRHLNKAVGASAKYRGVGSIGIIGAARSGLLVGADPDDEERRIIAGVKNNLAPPVPALAYRLEDAGNGVARLRWEGPTSHTAAQLLAQPTDQEERGALDEAVDILRSILADGPLPAKEVRRQARDAGIADRTLDRAKSRLAVIAERNGFGSAGGWTWRLPASVGTPHPRHLAPYDMPRRSMDADAEKCPSPLAPIDVIDRQMQADESSSVPKERHHGHTTPPPLLGRSPSTAETSRPLRCPCGAELTTTRERRQGLCDDCWHLAG